MSAWGRNETGPPLSTPVGGSRLDDRHHYPLEPFTTMALLGHRMHRTLRETGFGWAFVLLAGWVLWPPRAVYWSALAEIVGAPLTLVLVGALAVGLGFAVGVLRGVAIRPFVAGALLAYGSGMLAIEVVVRPESPVHLLLYGALLGCLVGGAVLGSHIG
ncbi:hypothetical protein HSRCO_0476 [Halanaeroarchaeum sp. HSR-CO]|nr:hypothetical protein HSRCO_0476 [Halanaeroarchaeum sp. HSR-CO]